MAAATSSSSASGRSIDVNEAALYYEEQGEGDPLIVIHPALDTSPGWQRVWPHPVDSFRVITLERGQGHPENP